jgi:phosphoenolpyruvate synthase/pyruvate phosphate dikinase
VGWHVYTRGTIPLLRIHHCVEEIGTDSERCMGFPVTRVLYYCTGGRLSWAWDEDEMRALGERTLRIMEDPGRLHEHVTRMRTAAQDAIEAAESVVRLDVRDHPDEALIALFREIVMRETCAQAWMNPEIDAVDILPAELVKQRIFDAVPEDERMRAFGELTAPAYVSYIAEEQIALLGVLDRMRKGAKTPEEMRGELTPVWQKFWWTSLGWESLAVKTVDDFVRDLEEYDRTIESPATALAARREAPGAVKAQRERIVRRFGISGDTMRLVGAFETYTELHDVRKEMQVKTFYAIHLLMREVARRVRMDPDDGEWFTIDEICSFLRGKGFPKGEAARRRQATFALLKDGSLVVRSGDEAIAAAASELGQDKKEGKELSGMGASPGFARGTVKVCNGAKDAFEKVGEGDVLVCGMTLPDYIAAMRKCVAIVTDEGGITCHAAVISRELRKPCVIGTRHATRTLKDGMIVDVDADRGVVRIITGK